MKFLVLALCVCAASAASFGQGFFPNFNQGYNSKAVPSGSGPYQFAKASASSGVPTGFNAKNIGSVNPAVYSANAVAQTVAGPAEYSAKTVSQTPVVAPAEYAAAKAVVQTPSATPVEYGSAKAVAQTASTPFEYAKSAVVAPVVAANYAKNVVYKDAEASIVRYDNEVQPEGFNYVVETNNGISANAAGALKKVGDVNVLAFQGAYRYTAPDGTPVVFTYVADENGYQPQSDLIPVAPPVPEAIARSLTYIASRAAVEKNQKY